VVVRTAALDYRLVWMRHPCPYAFHREIRYLQLNQAASPYGSHPVALVVVGETAVRIHRRHTHL